MSVSSRSASSSMASTPSTWPPGGQDFVDNHNHNGVTQMDTISEGITPEYGTVTLSEKERSQTTETAVDGRSKRTYALIVLLMLAIATDMLTYGSITPFFPDEAETRGMSTVQTGISFSIFEFVGLMMTPVFGRYITQIGPRFLFASGLFVTGGSTVIFGALKDENERTTFFVLTLLVRVFQALGSAASTTAAYTIGGHEFPERVGTIVGLLELGAGVGICIGPSIGGLLYDIWGFGGPFFALGSFMLGTTLVTIGLLEMLRVKKPPEPQQRRPTMSRDGTTDTTALSSTSDNNEASVLRLVKIPAVHIQGAAVLVVGISMSFLLPTMEERLEQLYNLTPVFVGLMFLPGTVAFSIAGPVLGYVCDQWSTTVPYTMSFGAVVAGVACMLLGPTPALGLPNSLWITGTALAMIGSGTAGLYMPTYSTTRALALANGFPDTMDTYGCVSGYILACFNIGSLFGPLLGSAVTQSSGFEWAATWVGFINFVAAVFVTLYFGSIGIWSFIQKYQKREHNFAARDKNGTLDTDTGIQRQRSNTAQVFFVWSSSKQ